MVNPAFSVSGDDHSSSFSQVRAILRADPKLRYVERLQLLTPRYARVWVDIAAGYLGLAAFAASAIWLARLGGWWQFAGFLLAALATGYLVAYLQLFLHEASHYNLVRDRTLNDRLSDLFIGWLSGSSIAGYRPIHFQHHRALGTVEDSEFTYFVPLNAWFLLKGLTGWRAIEVILARRKILEQRQVAKPGAAKPGRDWSVVLGGIFVHLFIVVVLALAGGLAPAFGWVVGIGLVFPFFGALRQLLEHRREDADAAADYSSTDHGALTRMFGTGLIASTLGGAGFNRHLLHHWEPQISYTRLAELETIFMETELSAVIDARRSGYGAVFMRLFAASGRAG